MNPLIKAKAHGLLGIHIFSYATVQVCHLNLSIRIVRSVLQPPKFTFSSTPTRMYYLFSTKVYLICQTLQNVPSVLHPPKRAFYSTPSTNFSFHSTIFKVHLLFHTIKNVSCTHTNAEHGFQLKSYILSMRFQFPCNRALSMMLDKKKLCKAVSTYQLVLHCSMSRAAPIVLILRQRGTAFQSVQAIGWGGTVISRHSVVPVRLFHCRQWR